MHFPTLCRSSDRRSLCSFTCFFFLFFFNAEVLSIIVAINTRQPVGVTRPVAWVLCAANKYSASASAGIRNIKHVAVIETRRDDSETHVTQGKKKQKEKKTDVFPEVGFCISVSFSTCIFNSVNMSVSVCIKGRTKRDSKKKTTKIKKKNQKLKGICRISLSIWHLENIPVGSESRYLVTCEAVARTKWIWHVLTQGSRQNEVRLCSTRYL